MRHIRSPKVGRVFGPRLSTALPLSFFSPRTNSIFVLGEQPIASLTSSRYSKRRHCWKKPYALLNTISPDMVKHDTWSLPSTPDSTCTVITKLPRLVAIPVTDSSARVSRAASVHRCVQWLRMNLMKRSGFHRQNPMNVSGFYRQRNQLGMPNACARCLAPNLGSFHRLCHNLNGIHGLGRIVALCIALILQGVTMGYSMLPKVAL